LANRYAESALAAGHEVRRIDVARLDFPILRNADEFYNGRPCEAIRNAQSDIAWADHLAFFYPLWSGDMPALLKAFVEQTFRPGFALGTDGSNRFPKKLLTGKSARIVVTMGMPAFVYRTLLGAHSLKSVALSLGMCGIAPIEETLIGGAGNACETSRRRWLDNVAILAQRDGRPSRNPNKPLRALAVAGAVAASAYLAHAAWAWTRFGNYERADSILDGVMPEYDVRLRHEITIDAGADVVFDAIQDADLEGSPIVRALFRAREVLLRGRRDEQSAPGGLLEQLESLGWRIVGRDPGCELAFGAVTQPWRANPEFHGLPPAEFARFQIPGYTKIAFTLRVDPIDEKRSIASTQTRALATDAASRVRFRWYWALLSPGIELIRYLLLRQLKCDAEARQERPSPAAAAT
jgi:putative NADPH-quinone reductase